MPTLNFRAETTNRAGQTVAAPAGLARSGPLVPTMLMVSDSHRQLLASQGKAVPDAVHGLALIDTGASNTCFDQQAALNAGLPVMDMGMMTSASHTKQDVPVFAGRLVIPEFTSIDTEYALGANLGGQNLIALIGRDLLQSAVLVYNGTDGTVSLSI